MCREATSWGLVGMDLDTYREEPSETSFMQKSSGLDCSYIFCFGLNSTDLCNIYVDASLNLQMNCHFQKHVVVIISVAKLISVSQLL